MCRWSLPKVALCSSFQNVDANKLRSMTCVVGVAVGADTPWVARYHRL